MVEDVSELRDKSRWNNDDDWVQFIESLRKRIEAIASKYTEDLFLREDAIQNAYIELMQTFPEEIRGYEDYYLGKVSGDRWQEILTSYCLMVCRNEILSTLYSHTTGNMYIGRTRNLKVKTPDGKKITNKKHIPARYVSLDALVEDSGLQISEQGELSWVLNDESVHGDENT